MTLSRIKKIYVALLIALSFTCIHAAKDTRKISEIIDGKLYVGNLAAAAFSPKMLKEKGISVIINCCNKEEEFTKRYKKFDNIDYHFCPIKSAKKKSIKQYFKPMYIVIDTAIKNNQAVLIHCIGGKHRSIALCTSYIMKAYNMSRIDAFDLVEERREEAVEQFDEQLDEYAIELAEEKKTEERLKKATNKNKQNALLQIPTEVQAVFFSYLDEKNSINVYSTCKEFRKNLNYLAQKKNQQNLLYALFPNDPKVVKNMKKYVEEKTKEILEKCEIKNTKNLTDKEIHNLLNYLGKNLEPEIFLATKPHSKTRKILEAMSNLQTICSLLIPQIQKHIKNKTFGNLIKALRGFDLLDDIFLDTNHKNTDLKLCIIVWICLKNNLLNKNNLFKIAYQFMNNPRSMRKNTFISKVILNKALKHNFIPLIELILNDYSYNITAKTLSFFIKKHCSKLYFEAFKMLINKAKTFEKIDYDTALEENVVFAHTKKIKLIAEKATLQGLKKTIRELKMKISDFKKSTMHQLMPPLKLKKQLKKYQEKLRNLQDLIPTKTLEAKILTVIKAIKKHRKKYVDHYDKHEAIEWVDRCTKGSILRKLNKATSWAETHDQNFWLLIHQTIEWVQSFENETLLKNELLKFLRNN